MEETAPPLISFLWFSDVYEVPDTDGSPVTRKCSAKLQPPALRLPPKPSPRLNIKKPSPSPSSTKTSCNTAMNGLPYYLIIQEPDEDDDYEVCNDDDSPTSSPQNERPEKKTADDRRPSIPVPVPREPRHHKPPLFPKTGISRDHEASPTSAARDPPNPAAASTSGFYRAKISLPRESPHQKPPAADKGSLSREDSGVRQQEEVLITPHRTMTMW
ncbi:hypothetical protein NFI96_023530 [Prochilodus magdalenae]|nr:hypothetical protein NFI96_023530 [Prochilodus magdalenae]